MVLDIYNKREYYPYVEKIIFDFLLFRVMEIQRICEVTATPLMEGANLSECTRTIRGFNYQIVESACFQADFFDDKT